MKPNRINKDRNVLQFYVIEKANDWGLETRFNNNQQIKIVGID